MKSPPPPQSHVKAGHSATFSFRELLHVDLVSEHEHDRYKLM